MSIYVVSGVKVNLLAYPPAMLYNMLLCYISATFKSTFSALLYVIFYITYPPAACYIHYSCFIYCVLACFIYCVILEMWVLNAILCYDVLYYKIATMMCFVKLYCAMMYCTIK